MATIFYCNDPFKKGCHWSGEHDELVCTDADDGHFIYCPNCEGKDFDEDDDGSDDEDEEEG